MSWLSKDSAIHSAATTSQEGQENRTLKVTLLSSEWKSLTPGDSPTISRELAIQLAKHSSVDVSVFLPNCSAEDRSSAESHNVKLIEAERVPGFDPVLWLSSPPRNHEMDCVIGHGVRLGQPIALIKRNSIYSQCKWIQVVHSAPEEDGMYKNISEGEKMRQTELELCRMADQVITIGPRLAEAYKRYLCHGKQAENVFDLTPSIFSEFVGVEQASKERQTFCVLVIGSGDSCEDFNVEGYDIAAKAIAELKDESYKLRFVCAPGGKGDQIVEKLLHGISGNQQIVRSVNDNREVLTNLFLEVDLAIMPSRAKGFGIIALEALSAGLPILASGNSGLGKALKEVHLGSYCVVDSEDPKDWAKEIKYVRQKNRQVRLSESKILREKYLEKYSWEEACKSLVERMNKLAFGSPESRPVSPTRHKRPTSIVAIDWPSKRPRVALTHYAHHEGGNEQVIRNLQLWQQEASRCKISSSTDPLAELRKIASVKGFRISHNPGSGNCMFYALSEQLESVKGVKIHHFELRHSLVQYLREHPKLVDGTDLFHFIDKHSTWDDYLTDMEQDGTWGDHVILLAAANCYQIAIHVISSLPNNSEVIINPDSPLDNNKHLVLGHVHEVHYVSLQPLEGLGKEHKSAHIKRSSPGSEMPKKRKLTTDPLESWLESRTTEPSRNKRLVPFSRDQSYKRRKKELTDKHHFKGDSLAEICSFVKEEYKRRSLLRPFFWNNTIQLALYDVYTPLKILSRSKRDFQLTEKEVVVDDIFKDKDDVMVLVEGSSGIGKTTLCLKIANDWVNKEIPKESSFSQFEVVLLLKCRDFHGNITNAIYEQLLPEGFSETILEEFINRIEYSDFGKKVLIILDGLNELPTASEIHVNKLFKKKIFPHCHILVTSRQEKGINARKKANFNLLLQIKGFTKKDAFEYIRKYFRGALHVSTGEELFKEIQENTLLNGLLENPLNLFLLCVVFEDHKGKLPSYRTNLYEIIVGCILRRYLENDKVKTPAVVEDLKRHFEDSLVVLGELAWECLKEDRFSFREEELEVFESGNENLAVRKLGLVYKEISLNKIDPQHEYFFFHETFQEYFAALYLAHKLVKQRFDISELRIDFHKNIKKKYREVFLFICGTSDEAAGLLLEQIGKMLEVEEWDWFNCTEEEATFFKECFSESRNGEQVAMALCNSFPLPQTITFNLLNKGVPTSFLNVIKFCDTFSQLQRPVDLKIANLGWVHDSTLVDFLASYTRLKTLSISVWKMTEETTTLLCQALRVSLNLHSFTLKAIDRISSDKVIAISDSLAASKTLTTVTFKLPIEILKDWVAILVKGLTEDAPLTSVVLEIFGAWRETEAEVLGKILSKKSLKFFSLTIFGDLLDSVATSIGEGLTSDPSLKSLALIAHGRISYSGLTLLKNAFLGNSSLESLELKVFGELPANWWNVSETLHSTKRSTMSFRTFPTVTGIIAHSQVACSFPVLEKNLVASNLQSLTVNIWGELNSSGVTDLCERLRASSASCVNLNLHGNITDNIADCNFQKLLCNQTRVAVTLNDHATNSGNRSFREICLSADDSSSLEPVFTKLEDDSVTKLSVSINNPHSFSGDLGSTLRKSLAKGKSLTSLSLIFNDLFRIENIDALWDAVAKNMSLAMLSLTFNNYTNKGEDKTYRLSEGLAKNRSLTTLSLTVNNYTDMDGDWAHGLRDGLTQNTSLTTLSLTVNNYIDMVGDWTYGLRAGLEKNKSLTTLNLTVHNYSDVRGDWTYGLSDGLAKNESLTTLRLTVNNYSDVYGDWKYGLSDGLAKNKSLTTLSLTVNSYSNMSGDWTYGLSDGLAKNTSLTTLSLTVNNYSVIVRNVICGLSDGLAKNTSLTTVNFTLNNYSNTPINLFNGLGDALAKTTSLVALNLTLSNCNNLYEDWIHGLADALARNTSKTTISLELNIFSEGNLNYESSSV